MNELVRFGLDDGGSVIVEIASNDPGITRMSRTSDAIRSAATSFESAMGQRQGCRLLGSTTFQRHPPAARRRSPSSSEWN
jgi:hypothetical protein